MVKQALLNAAQHESEQFECNHIFVIFKRMRTLNLTKFACIYMYGKNLKHPTIMSLSGYVI